LSTLIGGIAVTKMAKLMPLVCIAVGFFSLAMMIIKPDQWFEYLCITGVACIGTIVTGMVASAIIHRRNGNVHNS